MASEKTPNLGLNQIDRTSPKTTYFDLEKYLDQNWRSVDDFAGDVNDGVNEIKKRLDTTERKAVTLEPGVQIVHAEKTAPFSLTGLSGRMLVNLLGRMGNCETVSEWSSNVAIAIDSNNKTNGSSSFKITLGSVPATASASFLTTPSRKYIAIADVKSGNTSKVAISVNGIVGAVGNEVTSGSVFAPSVVRFTAKEYFHIVTITGTGTTGNTFNMDSVRVYEISDADYAAAASLTPAQAGARYPYVDSVMPVRNPYAIRYGENLSPSFYEWESNSAAKISGAYEQTITVAAGTSVNTAVTYHMPTVPGTSYTFSLERVGSGLIGFDFLNAAKDTVLLSTGFIDANTATLTAPANAVYMRMWVVAPPIAGSYTFKNPMLNVGSTAKLFKPREDSMLALQTDLYADPVIGANADTVFERDGQYFKSKKWQGMTLDGALPWVYFGSGGGYKGVRVPVNNGFVDSERITKFDGKLIQHVFPLTGPDQSHLSPESGVVGLTISVADSGWADGYEPSQDDIKAYFFGYKAYDANTITPANAQAMTTATWSGTGTKYWVQRVGAANFTQSVPQQSYTGYMPYQLVYKLATPTVEPIASEGQLSFVEGDNQVEVGTGIVVREESKPGISNNQYWINGSLNGLGKLKWRTNKIFTVFKNGKDDNWSVIGHASDVWDVYGLIQAWIPAYKFDPAASYSTTYLMLDRSPVVPFTGSYAANEKTLLADLVDSVQQANTRLSVVENKKADKDNPAWLTPTLLNGWTNRATDISLVSYLKDSAGYVHVKGVVKPGTFGTPVFQLPVGYRPALTIVAVVAANTDNTRDVLGRVNIGSNGSVLIVPVFGTTVTDAGWVSLDSLPPFLAEK
ncbi:hypothetical protein NLX78_15995 [Paenibacillus sp. Lou8.1]|uniref:hypothetical protein n=1 Tax=Paenibacillus sp. Lou8.1 TaxID=2962041 RepID=UPI0020B7E440|nr:hypothetical protein [Paenibacillus sp. Lou8.1]MCP3808740.1 hypothetical protein [Paenibacillus sp. Lou8.1]